MQSGLKSATHRLTYTTNIVWATCLDTIVPSHCCPLNAGGAGRLRSTLFQLSLENPSCNPPDYNPKFCKLMGYVTLERETRSRRTRVALLDRTGFTPEQKRVQNRRQTLDIHYSAGISGRQPSEERINQRRHTTSQPSVAAEEDASTRKTLWTAIVPRLDCFQPVNQAILLDVI